MSDTSQTETNMHHDVKQWQHCSLFNLDLFNDEPHQHAVNHKDTIHNANIDSYCCSSSTPNVDETLSKKHLDHSCSFAVLQKNYTTKLEHVAERLLATENKNVNECSCCQLETNDGKGQSLNRKILLGSTAILDNFLRNSLKSPLTINSNNPTLSNSSGASQNAAGNVHIASTVRTSSTSQRRWHSERGSRHPNVRANLPLTSAQRQVLERYMNYPIIKPATNIRSHRRSSRQPITGKAVENTGTALSALAEQPLATLATNTVTAVTNLRKESLTQTNLHNRPLSSTSSCTSAASHHSALNRRCFLADTVVHGNQTKSDVDSEKNAESNDDDDDDDSISSDFDESTDEESSEILRKSSLVHRSSNPNLNHSETLLECAICYELKRVQKRTCCEFVSCSTCLNTYVEQKVIQGIVRIQCPNQECHIYLHVDEIHKRCTTPEVRQKLVRIFTEMNRSMNMKTCPRCSNIHEIDLEVFRSMRRAPTKVQCVACNLIWCFQCHSPWHDGIQCKEFRRGDRMLKKWAREVHYGQQNAQQCPSCKVYIQRTKGCDHIVCLRCKTEFCYKCGDRFRDIKFIGDHYSELSVLGCKYRFYPDNPWKRRLIRGSILGGKILAAPIIVCLAMVAGTVCAGIGLPAYCCFRLARRIKARRRLRCHAKLKEPVLMSYKILNEIVPPLIPREPVNIDGVKPGFNSTRPNGTDSLQVQYPNEIDIDPTNDAPIAMFDDCDEHISSQEKNHLNRYSVVSSSPNFPRLLPYTRNLRKSTSKISD